MGYSSYQRTPTFISLCFAYQLYRQGNALCTAHTSLWELTFTAQTLLEVHKRNIHKDLASRCGTVCSNWGLALWREWELEEVRQLHDSFPWALNCPDTPQHLSVCPSPTYLLITTGRHSCIPSPRCASSSLRHHKRKGDCKVCRYTDTLQDHVL